MEFQEQTQKIQENFKGQIKTFRTGRASADMISDIQVEAYGAIQPLSNLASIAVADAKMMTIEAWDKGLIKDIEKAIISSDRNISVAVDGDIIRVNVPEMTEETRRDIVKSLNEKLEQARVSIRKAREQEKKKIEKDEKQGSISEDDKRNGIKKLDEHTKSAISNLEQHASNKEKEIMTI